MREIKKKAKIFKVHIEGPPMEMLEINQSRIYGTGQSGGWYS